MMYLMQWKAEKIMKKIKIREGFTRNTLIFDFKKKTVRVRYFQITGKHFTLLPQCTGKGAGQDMPVISWLFFRWGQMPVGRLKADQSGSIKDDTTGKKYRISLRKDFYLRIARHVGY